MERGDFYEDDEPLSDVIRAFEEGQCGPGWTCQHFTITSSMDLFSPTVGCGCRMRPMAMSSGESGGA